MNSSLKSLWFRKLAPQKISEKYFFDANQFVESDLGNTLDGWPDERWLDIRSANVHSIMKSRSDLAKQKGCDGVEADNMDGYINNSGFNLTATDQLAFNRFIANESLNMRFSTLILSLDLNDEFRFSCF